MLGAKKKLFVAHRYNTVVIVGEGYYKKEGGKNHKTPPPKKSYFRIGIKDSLTYFKYPSLRKENITHEDIRLIEN